MLGARLLMLIQSHAGPLTRDVVKDLRINERTPTVSELVYALVITKRHLRWYIREHGLVDFAGDRIAPQELLPLELHSIQELNYQVGEFFDRALYHLARGYESEAAAWKATA